MINNCLREAALQYFPRKTRRENEPENFATGNLRQMETRRVIESDLLQTMQT